MKNFKEYFENINENMPSDVEKQAAFDSKLEKLVQSIYKSKNFKTVDDKEAQKLVFVLSQELLEVQGLPFNELKGFLMSDLRVKNIKDIDRKTLSNIKDDCEFKENSKIIVFMDTYGEYED